MWQYQIKQMGEIPPAKKENDPRDRYIEDLEKIVHKLIKNKFKIILMGDINIDFREDTDKAEKWKTAMTETRLANTWARRWLTKTTPANTVESKMARSRLHIGRNWIRNIWCRNRDRTNFL